MFEKQAKRAGLSDNEILAIAAVVASEPTGGDLMVGTGGARKLRHAGRGQGKSGGYRTIHYFGGDDVPVFLLSLIEKGEKANLTNAEKRELAGILPRIADAYRKREKI